MEISRILLVLLCAIAVVFISKIFTKSKLKAPPGPKPWPIIGNILQIGAIPHQSFHYLSKRYGEIMLLKIGSKPVVIASSPEMAKQFLKVHDAVFASRPPIAAGYYISYNHSFVALAPLGPYWRQTRKICLSEVLNAKKLESFEQAHVEETCRFISHLKVLSETGKPVVLRHHLARHTLSVTSRMMFREECYEDEKMDELHAMVDEWFVLAGAFNIGDWLPWLGFLDLQGYVRRMKALNEKFDEFYDDVIDDHLARRRKDGDFIAKDVMDVVLQIADDPNLEVKLTRKCVKALIQNLLLGGIDTSASTVEWAIYEILKQPQIMEKAKDELDKVVGRKKWVEENDFPKLPYLEAIIKETFRLHPPSTLIPHYAIHDCNVAGYDVVKGTTVLINAWSIGRDPGSWDAPEKFMPERFIGKEIDVAGNHFMLLPFGSGRRGCPGYRLGLKMVRMALANLIRGFEIKLAQGMNPQDISMEEEYGLITYPKQLLPIIMEPTLPAHLY